MSPDNKIDITALMEQIRQAAKQSAADGPALKRYESPAQVFHDGNDSPLLYADELNFLNANWNYHPELGGIASHRPLVGKVIVKLKRLVHKIIWNIGLLGFIEYLCNFQANLVRHLNHSARYIEARNAKLFWNLNHKVDNDITSINERTDRLFDLVSAEMNARMRELEKRVAELEGQVPERKKSNQS
jgi:hypothetical protein